jgi:ribosomal protein S1
MSEKYFRGKIISINNDKKKVTIEYISNNKNKTIQAIIDDKQQEKYIQLKLIKKTHRFLVGDHVKFVIKKSSQNVFFADHVLYEYNNSLEVLIQKATIENKFLGYVKKVDEDYFIKEIDSYLFFPLRISKFEFPPVVSESPKAISFKMINIEKPEKIMAELYNHHYTEGFLVAVKQHKSQQIIEAIIKKITPYGIFVSLSESGLESKIAINEKINKKIEDTNLGVDSIIKVKITHITSDRIVTDWVE